MRHPPRPATPAVLLTLATALCAPWLLPAPAAATEFAVSPIRADLKPGALTETVTVTNFEKAPLRVTIKVMAWSQDAEGNDVYEESGDLVYFPRQMDIPAEGRRIVRLGAKAPATGHERSYRMFIEEDPAFGARGGAAQVNFYFRFGVPVFLPPPGGRAVPQVGGAEIGGGKAVLRVRNGGNQHFRLTRVTASNGAGYTRELQGWYTLAGAQRSYAFEFPSEACRQTRKLQFVAEGEDGVRIEHAVDVDPAACR